jgi:hypothetical protein
MSMDDHHKYRRAVYDKFYEILNKRANLKLPARTNLKLSALLGYKDYDDMDANFTDEDRRICPMLASSHGYTIYRMLLEKRGLSESEVTYLSESEVT